MRNKNYHRIIASSLLAVNLFLCCFCFCACSETEERKEEAGVAVGFTLGDISSEVNGTTRAGENLASGRTVKVVVYKTGAQSSTNFVASKDYTVQSNGTLSATDGTDLRLIEDTYDFYAFTPSMTFTLDTPPTVSVPQKTDFAVSLTTGIKINKWTVSETSAVKRNITLDVLARKCAKVTFAIDLAEDVPSTITKTVITEAVMTAMPTTLTASGTTLDAGSGSGTVSLATADFTTDATNPRKASGSTIVLPKTSGKFKLSMKAQFNGVTSITTLFPATEVPNAIIFEANKHYTFTVRLTKDNMGDPQLGLWLTISSWVTSDQDYGLGGVPTGPVTTQLLGYWKIVMWDAGLGGVPTGPIITDVSGWWTNIYYNPHLGSSDPGSND